MFPRELDIAITGKRHPYICKYKVSFQPRAESFLLLLISGSNWKRVGRVNNFQEITPRLLQGWHRLEKYLNLEGFLEKSLKIKLP